MRELRIQIFFLKKEGFEPYIWYPNFTRPSLRDKMHIFLSGILIFVTIARNPLVCSINEKFPKFELYTTVVL